MFLTKIGIIDPMMGLNVTKISHVLPTGNLGWNDIWWHCSSNHNISDHHHEN